ncbi:MAG: HAMP domain-containing histidine kinase, partial [Spirochaetes bacterium]|nr:HAMP domain-containing histidine kinase [Spirochaetota bacterium]
MKILRIIRQQTPVIIVVILVLGNTIWHRFIPDNLMFLHNIYPLLYQFPIVLAGFYFGRIGGVATAAAVAALSIPHFLYLLHSDPMYLYKSFIEIVLYFIIGYTIGHIADAMRKEQREKQRLLEELRITEKNTTLGEIAHVISHELKTPIASITGAVDLLVEDDAAEDKKRIRDIIHKELLRMNNLIGGTFQTFHENRVEKKDISIELFFDEIRTLYAIMHAVNPVSLTISVVTKIKTMHVSHELLREAFLNLIDNAVEASTPNGRVDIT